MDLWMQLDNLQNRLSATLRNLPGATTLYLFGSRTTIAGDQYADIDLQVVTADLPAARATWPHFLENVGPMELAWPITADPKNTAFSVLFQGESYYHKVDVGLSALSDTTRFASASSYVPLWSQEPATSTMRYQQTSAYIPVYGTTGHTLFDELIVSVRYVKARKRGQHLTCWRFMRGKPDRLLQLTYEQLHGWKSLEKPLSTWNYKELDTLIGQSEQEKFIQHLNWSDSSSMNDNFNWLTQRIARLLQQKARAHSEAISSTIVEQHLAFIYRELNV